MGIIATLRCVQPVLNQMTRGEEAALQSKEILLSFARDAAAAQDRGAMFNLLPVLMDEIQYNPKLMEGLSEEGLSVLIDTLRELKTLLPVPVSEQWLGMEEMTHRLLLAINGKHARIITLFSALGLDPFDAVTGLRKKAIELLGPSEAVFDAISQLEHETHQQHVIALNKEAVNDITRQNFLI